MRHRQELGSGGVHVRPMLAVLNCLGEVLPRTGVASRQLKYPVEGVQWEAVRQPVPARAVRRMAQHQAKEQPPGIRHSEGRILFESSDSIRAREGSRRAGATFFLRTDCGWPHGCVARLLAVGQW